ncbi:uncharacterized protein LOC101055758 isoform X4 [Mus musculus]|uniref:uncharacterized protein LOC101055758 isoform X4 n=1 Tax=Mus musculus TaxID=10090 RepID=UPI0003D714B8|nr:uncharacterized protein LOC101055758 isoform X4 [Mus musculus]|eukprot:XP_006530042.1 PREDICTED: component of Sp100-rs-like isoform X4 [Mus musculus]
MYEDLLDSCRSLVPVDKVIYRALEELEKKFDMTVLCELFNEVNMEKYPDLNLIRRSFECGAKPALKTMNSSSEHCNVSDWLRLEATVKASVYVVAFSITTSLTVVIIAIVSQSLQLRKECFNPLVYGLHNRDLQSKLYPWLCCRKKLLP